MSTAQKVLEAMRAYNVQSKGGGRYMSNSPLRAGSDSMSFSLLIEDDEHGAFKDFASDTGESGSLYELARVLGIPTPVASPVDNSKRQYLGLEDYARAHGITAEHLSQWAWRESSYKGRAALEFQTANGRRWRFIDGNAPHYISEKDYVRCWYGLSSKLVARATETQTLIICNGEISTIAGQVHAMPSIAVTAGEKEIPGNLIAELKGKVAHIEGLQIIVAMDCDATGIKAGAAVLRQMLDAGFNARAVDLQLGRGGDLADFIKLHGNSAMKQLRSCPDIKASQHTVEQHRIISLEEVLKLPPVPWLVKGILPAVGLSMVFGPSGVGKSFYALGLSFDLAFEHSVIYVAAEGESGMSVRARALIKHHGKMPQGLSFHMGQVDLFDDSELTGFKQLSARYNPALIVVDTLAMCTGIADENSARDMKIIIDGSKRMAKELNCAVMLVHHTNKAGREARGSGSLFNACDTVLRLTRSDDVLLLESQKTKDLKSFSPLYLKEVSIELGRDEYNEPVTSLVLLPAEQVLDSETLSDLQRLLVQTLIADPSSSLRDLAIIAEVNNPGVISRTLNKMQERGIVTGYDNGMRTVTPLGIQMLNAAQPPAAEPAKQDAQISVAPRSQQVRMFNQERTHYEGGL